MDDTSHFKMISNTDIWVELQGIHATLNGVLTAQQIANSRTTSTEIKVEDHEQRLRRLAFQFYGVLAAMLAYVGILVTQGGVLPS